MIFIHGWGSCVAQNSAHFQAESLPILDRNRRPLSTEMVAHFAPEYTADHSYQFLGLSKTKVKREDLPVEAPRALTKNEQKKLMRAAECARRAKDRAVVTLLHTGIRISECADLNLDDVYAQGRKNRIILRNGKGGRYCEIPLNAEACEAIQSWLQEREEI